jgi:hypothetical protein
VVCSAKKNEVKNIKIKVIGLISNLNNMIKKYIIIANKFTKKIITKKRLKKKKELHLSLSEL